MTKVAVITRTKDRPLFLERALDSVANQTYLDYIHVIVNDGGDKSPVETLVSNLSKDQQDKTRIFHRDTSSNAPDTIFNESIDRVESEYFAIHDDDDTWHPEFLQQAVAVLDADDQLGGIVARSEKVIEKATDDGIVFVKSKQYMPDMRAISLYRQYLDNQLTPIATLFRRSAYEAVGKFDDSLPIVGDWEFGVRLLQKYEFEYLDPGFALANYHHRQQGENSFTAHSHRKYITLVMNRYLRKELADGKLGAGYIMNSLRYEQDMLTTVARKILPKPVARFVRKKVK